MCVCVCVFVCDLETSKIRLTRSDLSCYVTEKENVLVFHFHDSK